MKRRRPNDGRFFEPDDPSAPSCDWQDCASDGLYRAPRAPDDLENYYWFCMDHVRAYNASWNYYAGMSREQVEQEIRADVGGNRPTWRMGARIHPDVRKAAAQAGRPLDDPFGFFDDEPRPEEGQGFKPKSGSAEEEALCVLDLQSPLTLDALKNRYKELVKRHHPDVNNGDRKAEERFKKISMAYQTLIHSLSS